MATICSECHECFKTTRGRDTHWGRIHKGIPRRRPGRPTNGTPAERTDGGASDIIDALDARVTKINEVYKHLVEARAAVVAALREGEDRRRS